MPNLLLISHCPSLNTEALRDAVIEGVRHPDISEVTLRSLAPLDADADDVRWADGIILGTTENFGYMAGRIKDFFERIYYPCLEETQGLPVALYIRAGLDGEGTRIGIERIAMLKYGMPDLRPFYESDVRWLRHFGFLPLEVPSMVRGL